MSGPSVGRRGLLILCAGAAAVVPGLASADETRASADVSAGVGYSNNPFTGTDAGGSGSSGSVFGQVGISPEIRILNERRVIAVGGDLFYQDYFNDYRSTASYQAHADYSDRLTESTSVHARLGYLSARLGTLGFGGLGGLAGGTLDPVVGPPNLDPTGAGAGAGLANPTVGVPLLPGADVGAFGAGQRQRTLTANADFSSALSSRDTLTGSAFYLNSSYGRSPNATLFGTLGDYDGYGSTLGVRRTLSEFTSVGIQGSVSSYNYDASQGDTRVYSLQGTVSTRLNQFWSLDASLGASYQDQQRGDNGTTLSGSANLCRRGERTNTCILVARSVVPTGFAGTQTQTSAGLSWQMQVGELDNLSLGASYVDLSGGNSNLGALDDQYALANAGYTRSLGQRLRLSPSIFYRKVFGGSIRRDDDYGGQVSLSYRLGDLR